LENDENGISLSQIFLSQESGNNDDGADDTSLVKNFEEIVAPYIDILNEHQYDYLITLTLLFNMILYRPCRAFQFTKQKVENEFRVIREYHLKHQTNQAEGALNLINSERPADRPTLNATMDAHANKREARKEKQEKQKLAKMRKPKEMAQAKAKALKMQMVKGKAQKKGDKQKKGSKRKRDVAFEEDETDATAPKVKTQRKCRFVSKGTCRNGDECPFRHDTLNGPRVSEQTKKSHTLKNKEASENQQHGEKEGNDGKKKGKKRGKKRQ
jgi:hypothetical protein